jgi:hypothetical protein
MRRRFSAVFAKPKRVWSIMLTGETSYRSFIYDIKVVRSTLIKARLHFQFSLRFLVRVSPSDGCERVDELRMF